MVDYIPNQTSAFRQPFGQTLYKNLFAVQSHQITGTDEEYGATDDMLTSWRASIPSDRQFPHFLAPHEEWQSDEQNAWKIPIDDLDPREAAIVSWLSDTVPLNRIVDNLEEDFDDGILVAEILHSFSPTLVTTSDLVKFNLRKFSRNLKRKNWRALNTTALKQLSIQLSEEFVDAILDHRSFEAPFRIPLFRASQELSYIQTESAAHQSPSIAKLRAISRLLILIKDRITWYQEEHSNLQVLPAIRLGEDTSHMILYQFPGTRMVSEFASTEGNVSKKTLIRLTNVDYTTRKRDVLIFLYPIITLPEDIHIPIHLSTGKMTYDIYVEFADPLLPHRVIQLCSGQTLLSRRIEAQLVAPEDLLVVLFGRTHKFIDETTVFLTEDQKERMWKLCWNAKNTFNGKTPSRPFEHILSYIKLLPWHDSKFSQDQKDRACSLLKVAMKTLSHYDDQKHAFAPSLISEMLQVVQDYVAFSPTQKQTLQRCVSEDEQDETSQLLPRPFRRHSHDGVVRRLEQLALGEKRQDEVFVNALGHSLWNAMIETKTKKADTTATSQRSSTVCQMQTQRLK